MIEKFFNSLRWLYWKVNRGFLAAFAEALIGRGRPDLLPDGKVIVERLEKFLAEIPGNVFRQLTLVLMAVPVWQPKRMPRSDVGRFFVKVWISLVGNVTRYRWPSYTYEERLRRIDELFDRLSKQTAEQEDDRIKSIIILNTLKQLLSSAYLELDTTWKALGYSPYPIPPRTWTPPSGPVIENPPRTPNSEYLIQNARRARDVRHKVAGRTNYCVIGSGAGGAVAAQRILELDPQARVVMLESGPLVTNDKFPLHIMDALPTIYMNTGTTLSRNMKYTFRQGRCVGGSTAINNGVAIKPTGFWWEDNIVRRWKEVGANLDYEEFHRSYDSVGVTINVHPLETRALSPMSAALAQGFERVAPEKEISVVPVNTTDCIGCGRCNAGCQYDSKQSMLTTFIPEFIRAGGLLVPNAHAERLVWKEAADGKYDVQCVVVTTEEGEEIEIEADKFVLASGAYASTKLLWKSNFTGEDPGVRTVGKRFTGNMGSPVFGRFATPLNGWAGQQIGYLVEVPDERLVIETGFGPPVALGLAASQWGDDFMRVVENYSNFGVAVPVFSSLAYGEITRGLLPTLGWLIDYRLGGFIIDFELVDEDWRRLARGMKLCAKAMFEMGAEEVFTTRFDSKGIKPGDNIDDYFDNIGPYDYFHVETAHLQGGNVINEDPQMGVVDGGAKVHGFNNLWICDASIIPSPITVNIQYTVMALSHYMAKGIVAA